MNSLRVESTKKPQITGFETAQLWGYISIFRSQETKTRGY